MIISKVVKRISDYGDYTSITDKIKSISNSNNEYQIEINRNKKAIQKNNAAKLKLVELKKQYGELHILSDKCYLLKDGAITPTNVEIVNDNNYSSYPTIKQLKAQYYYYDPNLKIKIYSKVSLIISEISTKKLFIKNYDKCKYKELRMAQVDLAEERIKKLLVSNTKLNIEPGSYNYNKFITLVNFR